MKSIVLYAICFYAIFPFFSLNAQNATSIKVNLNEGTLMKNLAQISSGSKIKKGKSKDFIMAVKHGCVTYSEYVDTILASHREAEFNINLQPFTPPRFNGKLKKIKFETIRNQTGQNISYYYLGPNKVPIYSSFTTSDFIKAINSELELNHFDVSTDLDKVFKETKQNAQLRLAGELIEFRMNTKGTPGFEIAVMIKWSLFDINEEKVIYTLTTGGYSNSGKRGSLRDEISPAIINALDGLIASPKFCALVQNTNASVNDMSGTVELPYVEKSTHTDYASMIQSSLKSVVTIQTATGSGSGFLIGSSGYILTTNHLLKQGDNIEVVFSNDLSLSATLVSKNENLDIALLKVEGNGFKPLPTDSATVKIKSGTDVIALGSGQTVQSVKKGTIEAAKDIDNQEYIQFSPLAAANLNGGALLNNSGQVVGIIVSKPKSESTDDRGYAIPIRSALKALNITLKY